ncbi:MAG: hypothetical protein QXL86_02320, partial [Candidatus Aenigmatarchaeota archaeon]
MNSGLLIFYILSIFLLIESLELVLASNTVSINIGTYYTITGSSAGPYGNQTYSIDIGKTNALEL